MRVTILKKKPPKPTRCGNIDFKFFAFKIIIEACYSSLLFHFLKQRKSSSLQAPLAKLCLFVFLHTTMYCHEVLTWYEATECLKDDNFEPLAISGIPSIHVQPLWFYLTADSQLPHYLTAACSKGREPQCASHTQHCSNKCDSCVSFVGHMQSDCCILIATAVLIRALR